MLVLDLALKSLRNRAFSTSLTVGSIALSVALLVGVENVRVGMRESFSNTISQTDLIVGTKGGTIQLLLYSVFGMGAPTENVSWEAYRQWAEHPRRRVDHPLQPGGQPPGIPGHRHERGLLSPLPLPRRSGNRAGGGAGEREPVRRDPGRGRGGGTELHDG